MVMWGAICGGVLGLLWRGHDWEIHLLVGMVLGALAGRGLRGAVRAEIKAALAAMPAAAPVVAAARVDDAGAAGLPGHPAATAAGPTANGACRRTAATPCPAAEAAATRSHHRRIRPGTGLAFRRQYRRAHGRPGAVRRTGLPGEVRHRQCTAAARASACRHRRGGHRAVRGRVPVAGQGTRQAGLRVDVAGRRGRGAVPHGVRGVPALPVPSGGRGVRGAGPDLRLGGRDRGGAERDAHGLHRICRRLRRAYPGFDGPGQSRRLVLLLPAARRGHRRAGLGQGLAAAQPAGFLRHLRRGNPVGRAEVPPRALRYDRAVPDRLLPGVPGGQPALRAAPFAGTQAGGGCDPDLRHAHRRLRPAGRPGARLRIRHRLLVAGDGRLVPGAGLVDGATHRRPG